MARDDLDTLYCRFIDSVVNHRRLDHLDQFVAADVVEHAPARTVGLAAVRQRLADWLTAFPDLHLVIGFSDIGLGWGDRVGSPRCPRALGAPPPT